MTAPPARRYPMADLERHLAARGLVARAAVTGPGATDAGVTDDDIAEILGVSSDCYGRWRRRGWIGEPQADRCTIAIGLNLGLVWPDIYYAGTALDPAAPAHLFDDDLELTG